MARELYNVPRNSRIKLQDGTELNFHHIDGMYSYCTTDAGEVVHIATWAVVELVEEKQDEL